MKRCNFTKEEFYSNIENEKIALLCELNEKGKLKNICEENLNDIEKTIDKVHKDLEGEIQIKKLEEFLRNKDKQVIKRLGLINIILPDFDSHKEYVRLKETIERIKEDIFELSFIKNSLLIFFRNKHKNEIRNIIIIIKELQESSINNYKSEKTKEGIKNIKRLKDIAEDVEKVKDFLLFKVLYDEAHGSDEGKRFKEALDQLDDIKSLLFSDYFSASEIYNKKREIFNKIREILGKNESIADKFITQMIDYFKIKDKKELINEITLIFKSKIYEMDLKSIIYFFENLNYQKGNNKDKWNEKLSSKYKRLSEMNLDDLKKSLVELKNSGIYNYEKRNKSYLLFNSLYEKKEAINFLLSKRSQDSNLLYERIDPTKNRMITKNDIQATEECINIFNKFKQLNDNFQIFNYIKNLTEEQIYNFKIYSENYSAIIELDRTDDSSYNLYKQVHNYVRDATFIFRQDTQDFSYGENGITNMEELIHIKDQIYINPPIEKDPKDILQKKCFELIFFQRFSIEFGSNI